MSNTTDRHPAVAFAALLILASGLLVVLRPRGAEYLERLRRANAHAENGERSAAVAAYREAARSRPGDPLPHMRLSDVYLNWGRIDEALDAVSQAERLGAAIVDVERMRAAIHEVGAETSKTAKLSHWTAVVEHLRRVLTLAPDDGEARHSLARAHLGLCRWDAAESAYRALLSSDRGDRIARERLGAMLLGDDPLAPEYLEAAGTELAGRLLAVLEEARPTGNSAFVTTLLGRTLVERDEWALAARQLERAVSQDVGFSDAHAYLGYALDQVGCFDQARPHLLRAIALNPDSAVAHTFLGLHYDRWDHFGAARAEYERAYDLAPTNPAISVEIGQTWAAEGRYVAGEIWLREAVSLRPYDPELWEILVRFYLDHNITAGGRAVEAAEKLLVLAPHLARAHDLRGWAALQVGDYEVADEHMRRAIKLDPELASAHYHLGVLLTAQGRGGEAEESLTRAVDLDTRGEFVQLVERARSRETSAKR